MPFIHKFSKNLKKKLRLRENLCVNARFYAGRFLPLVKGGKKG
jgi:hypothetical protein